MSSIIIHSFIPFPSLPLLPPSSRQQIQPPPQQCPLNPPATISHSTIPNSSASNTAAPPFLFPPHLTFPISKLQQCHHSQHTHACMHTKLQLLCFQNLAQTAAAATSHPNPSHPPISASKTPHKHPTPNISTLTRQSRHFQTTPASIPITSFRSFRFSSAKKKFSVLISLSTADHPIATFAPPFQNSYAAKFPPPQTPISEAPSLSLFQGRENKNISTNLYSS